MYAARVWLVPALIYLRHTVHILNDLTSGMHDYTEGIERWIENVNGKIF